MSDARDRGEARSRLLAAPPADGGHFDPVPLVAAVNALVGGEVDWTIALLRDCAASATDMTAVALVARLLFRPREPDAPLPPPPFGRPDVPLPPAGSTAPYLPLALSLELPFLLVGGYAVGGAVDLGGWLERCAAAGTIREEPLRPRASPVEAADALTGGEIWTAVVPGEQRPRVAALVRGQALRAAGAAPEEVERIAASAAAFLPAEAERLWAEEASLMRERELSWDEGAQRFRPG